MDSALFTPGHDFAGRFRVLKVLGVGRTAEVYLAHDGALDRQVVVKALLPDLAQHEDVRRTFRDRIVRASALTSPHIARVYDGGQEHGTMFVVTEYLGGGSLDDVLRSTTVMSVDDVARLGRDVDTALSELHAAGLVHGDLTPGKLLFDGEGMVRISDVTLAGLARPYRHYTSRDDVRYFSPEQARGEAITPASDVYALALMMYEAATGATPFEGLTADATLRARMAGTLASRPELGTLDLLLAQATVPDVSLRPTAAQFAERLATVVDDASFVRPATVAPSLLGSFAPSQPRTSIGFRPPSAQDIVSGVSHVVSSTPPASSSYPSTPSRRSAPGSFEEMGPIARVPRRRPVFAVAAALLVVIALGAGAVWKLGYLTPKHAVPNLSGMSQSAAAQLIKSDSLVLDIGARVASTTVPSGYVISQTPTPGTSLKNGGVVTVTLSSGQTVVTLPTNLVGKTCAADTATLAALAFKVSCPASARVSSTHTAAGLVAAVVYKATQNPLAAPQGATLVLAVSTGAGSSGTTPTTTTTTTVKPGQGPRAVPNLDGVSRVEANTLLGQAGLYFNTKGPGAHTPAWTKVVSTIPAAGTMVPWHSTVILNVSEG